MDLTINIYTDPEFIQLQTVSSSMKLEVHPEGRTTIGFDNNGLILYHYLDETFYAFDATCPHDLPESISLEVDGSKATCPKCGSVYLLSSEGVPSNGSISRHSLKKYRSVFYSDGSVHVYN